MNALRREKYLETLGIVQYRRRSLTLVRTEPEPNTGLQTIEEPAGEVKSQPDRAERSSRSVQSSAPFIDHIVESARESMQGLSEEELALYSFDLLVWRSAKVLVLEFSASESEFAQLKHRLANNILKALWPQEFAGVELHQHSWPMPGIATDLVTAREWLNSLVAGHLQHETGMPIWVMGEQGLKMLFPDRSDFSELIGGRMHHETLNVELLITPGLKQVSESTVLKAQVWQLLKSIR